MYHWIQIASATAAKPLQLISYDLLNIGRCLTSKASFRSIWCTPYTMTTDIQLALCRFIESQWWTFHCSILMANATNAVRWIHYHGTGYTWYLPLFWSRWSKPDNIILLGKKWISNLLTLLESSVALFQTFDIFSACKKAQLCKPINP